MIVSGNTSGFGRFAGRATTGSAFFIRGLRSVSVIQKRDTKSTKNARRTRRGAFASHSHTDPSQVPFPAFWVAPADSGADSDQKRWW